MNISLRAGDRIYINGAVLSVDRKVSIVLLNKATFLLGAHVLQADGVTTPLRQVYFVVQSMLMDPGCAGRTIILAREMVNNCLRAFEHPKVLLGLKLVDEQVVNNQFYDALKTIRALYPIEEEILRGVSAPSARIVVRNEERPQI